MSETIKRHDGTQLRVMSWNILSEELTPSAPPITERMDTICDVIMRYRPELAGIQEISESAYKLFEEKLGDTYEFVNPMTKEGLYSFTGITYDKTKYRLIDSDIENSDGQTSCAYEHSLGQTCLQQSS